MKTISRSIDPASASDLLTQVPRACLAFSSPHGAQSQPVTLKWHENRYFVGLPERASDLPAGEVVLLVDQGVHFFDLRAIYIRGQVQPVDPPSGADSGYTWFEVIPTKTVAWDYGTLHEVNDEA